MSIEFNTPCNCHRSLLEELGTCVGWQLTSIQLLPARKRPINFFRFDSLLCKRARVPKTVQNSAPNFKTSFNIEKISEIIRFTTTLIGKYRLRKYKIYRIFTVFFPRISVNYFQFW
jgi:hypothetical protein